MSAVNAPAIWQNLTRQHEEKRAVWEPQPGPQQMAYTSEADELLFGGAAGGGKSDLIIGYALTRSSRARIYRREAEQLKGIADRIEELAGPASNKTIKRWRIGDKIIDLGGVQYENDWRKYKGDPRDFIAFDELSEFMESQYRMLISWLRTAKRGQRTRVIASSNPPTGEDGRWMITHWAPWLDPKYPNPAEPGELRWYAYDGEELVWFDSGDEVEIGGRMIRPASRTFIPSLLSDNRYLFEDGNYERRLMALPEAIRDAYLHGDFFAMQEEDPTQVIPAQWVYIAQERWSEEPPGPMTTLGVDPARGGRDQTVMAPRHGEWIGHLITRAGADTPDGPTVAAHATEVLTDNAIVVLDPIGIGAAVEDALSANGVAYRAFIASGSSEAKDKTGKFGFMNKRAEGWWRMRELLDPSNGHKIALPPDDRLRADLCAPKWSLTVRGIKIESKKDIKKRLGRSTDRADAVIAAFDRVTTDKFRAALV